MTRGSGQASGQLSARLLSKLGLVGPVLLLLLVLVLVLVLVLQLLLVLSKLGLVSPEPSTA